MKRSLLTLSLALLITAGCDKAEAPTPPPAPPPPAAAPAPTVDVPGAEPKTAVADDQVPTEEDFENEATQRITPQNQTAALDQLEKEISAP
jgi:hypothetical protein